MTGTLPPGHPQVDAALERLRELDDRPVEDHAEVYEDVHRGLHDALAEASGDDGVPPPAGR